MFPTAVPGTIPPAHADVAASEPTVQSQTEGLPHSAVGETKQANAEGDEGDDEVGADLLMVPQLHRPRCGSETRWNYNDH